MCYFIYTLDLKSELTSSGEWKTALTLYTHKSKGMPNIRFAYTPIPMYIRTPRSCLSSVLYFFFSVMLL